MADKTVILMADLWVDSMDASMVVSTVVSWVVGKGGYSAPGRVGCWVDSMDDATAGLSGALMAGKMVS